MASADLKRVVIEPVTRVEGHGKVTVLLDEHNKVKQARLHIVEFRGSSGSSRAALTGRVPSSCSASAAYAG